jgi:hypothetical protein
VRFGDATWAAIQKEAEEEGVSASQFVREAALARVWFGRARRGSSKAHAFAALLDSAREGADGVDS